MTKLQLDNCFNSISGGCGISKEPADKGAERAKMTSWTWLKIQKEGQFFERKSCYDRVAEQLKRRTVRWRNGTQWYRNTLVQKGLMKRGSPRGVWEISPTGEEAIKLGDV